MTDTPVREDCCEDARRASVMSRRTLLKALGVGSVAIAAGPSIGMSAAFAADPGWSGDVLVVLSLRGGFDGLSAVAPIGDPNLTTWRPSIAVPAASAFQLDTLFGMHPALSALQPLWTGGKLAFAHATGMWQPNRSHFSAMDEMERAAPGTSARTGWLDRTLGLHAVGGPFSAVQMGSTSIPEAFAGPVPVLGMDTISSFKLSGTSNATQRTNWTNALNALHSAAPPGLQDSASGTLGALGTAATLAATPYTPANGAAYTSSDLSRSLKNAAQLIKADIGLRVLTIDLGDWDMHADLGRVDGGWMHDKLADLGGSLAAFATDLGTWLDSTTLVTISEFGRRVEENQSGGVDHGWGNLMMVLGGHVVQGVHVQMPTSGNLLDEANLTDGDLTASTDYRAVLADILVNRTGATSDQVKSVFPSYAGTTMGITTAA
ncbi:MAG TPA: DUF1501 domain-containing protein [Candidatus Nanopelagicales bacterium]|nr:DUF1501 domain-containing protein [Candidatus Nanopelagicales bacterium]